MCENCNRFFSARSSLLRHYKRCPMMHFHSYYATGQSESKTGPNDAKRPLSKIAKGEATRNVSPTRKKARVEPMLHSNFSQESSSQSSGSGHGRHLPIAPRGAARVQEPFSSSSAFYGKSLAAISDALHSSQSGQLSPRGRSVPPDNSSMSGQWNSDGSQSNSTSLPPGRSRTIWEKTFSQQAREVGSSLIEAVRRGGDEELMEQTARDSQDSLIAPKIVLRNIQSSQGLDKKSLPSLHVSSSNSRSYGRSQPNFENSRTFFWKRSAWTATKCRWTGKSIMERLVSQQFWSVRVIWGSTFICIRWTKIAISPHSAADVFRKFSRSQEYGRLD